VCCTKSHGSPSVAYTASADSVRLHAPSSGARQEVVCSCARRPHPPSNVNNQPITVRGARLADSCVSQDPSQVMIDLRAYSRSDRTLRYAAELMPLCDRGDLTQTGQLERANGRAACELLRATILGPGHLGIDPRRIERRARADARWFPGVTRVRKWARVSAFVLHQHWGPVTALDCRVKASPARGLAGTPGTRPAGYGAPRRPRPPRAC
jgi:hypothetical protein